MVDVLVLDGVMEGVAVEVGVTVKVGGRIPGRRVAVEIGIFNKAARVRSCCCTISGFCSVSASTSLITPYPMRGISRLVVFFE